MEIPQLDADLIARSFGAVIPITEPTVVQLVSSMPTVIEAPSGIVPSSEKRTAMTLLADLISTKPDSEELIERKQWLIDQLTPLLQEVDEFVNCVTKSGAAFLTDHCKDSWRM